MGVGAVSSDQAREFQEQGIQAAKAGQKDQARKFLQQAIRLEPRNETTWLWLASVAKDNRERLLCLQKVLQINPDNEMGVKAVRALGIDPEQLAPRGKTIQDSLASDEAVAEGPGVPMPAPDDIEAVRGDAEAIAAAYLQLPDMGDIVWEAKPKRRAGERELTMLRLQVGAMITLFLAIVGGGLIYAVMNVPQVQIVLFGASSTPIPPSRTPTSTATNTPGFTPTPSPTRDFTSEPTFTASPTVYDEVTPWPTGVLNRTPTVTPFDLPDRPSNEISRAIQMVAENGAEGAEESLPYLESARQQVEGTGAIFSPNPYYFQARNLMILGRDAEAFDALNEAQRRLDTGGVRAEDMDAYRTLIDLGFAESHLEMARRALEQADRATAVTHLEQARVRTQAVRAINPNMATAYVVEAEAHRLEAHYEQAIAILEDAYNYPALLDDQAIAIARGRVYLEWGNALSRQQGRAADAWTRYNQAAYAGYYAVYINPFNEEAHQLRIETAIAMGDIGLAAIRCEDYLFYVPNSAEAYRLFGDVRVAQGNTDIALYIYTQALQSEGTDEVFARTHISRAELYTSHRRFVLALDDLNAAIALRDLLATRALRLPVAYAAGAYDIAQEDAEALLDKELLTNSEIYLIQARILVDTATRRRDYERALALLNQVGNDIPAALVPYASEYRARAHYGMGNYADALEEINRALAHTQTGSRHYLHGLIFEASGAENDALAEYQWVLTWDEVYRYPFTGEVRARIQGIADARLKLSQDATATSVAATLQAEMTAEATGEVTPEATPEATPGGG